MNEKEKAFLVGIFKKKADECDDFGSEMRAVMAGFKLVIKGSNRIDEADHDKCAVLLKLADLGGRQADIMIEMRETFLKMEELAEEYFAICERG